MCFCQVKKAFFALVANGVRAAPLWDNKLKCFVGEPYCISVSVSLAHMHVVNITDVQYMNELSVFSHHSADTQQLSHNV